MKSCEKIVDKIIFFDDLSNHEQQEVKKHTETCARCRKYLKEFQTIIASIKGSQDFHFLNDNLLIRYSIYLSAPEESDYDGRKLTGAEITKIREHTAECDRCQQKVEQFCQEYQEIEDYLKNQGFPALSLTPNLNWSLRFESVYQLIKSIIDSIKNKILVPIPKYYPIAIGVAVVLFFMIWVGPLFHESDNPYFDLTTLEQDRISFLTRGNIPQPLSEGLTAFHEGNYQKAIQELEKVISTNSKDPTLYYAHYVLGISYLIEAKSDLFGWVQKFDSNLVDKGIQSLQIARSLNNTLRINEDCSWYIAKAYLMKNEGEKAKEVFERVLNMHGRRFREAKQIIKEIDTILKSH